MHSKNSKGTMSEKIKSPHTLPQSAICSVISSEIPLLPVTGVCFQKFSVHFEMHTYVFPHSYPFK